MAWQDLGLIFKVKNLSSWAKSHCYVPTAIEINDKIRVYASFWDENKYGRLGYVDVCSKDPSKILGYSEHPILADSQDGMFDCHGVTPLSIIADNNQLRLYYAGWQRFENSEKRYTIYTGLAISDNNGENFNRYSNQCIIGPRNTNDLVRTGGMVIKDGVLWRTWFASFSKNNMAKNKLVPTYNLSTMTSFDGINWNNDEAIVFDVIKDEIMGYGRSAIWKKNATYHGLFSVRSWDNKYYNIFYSTSINGVQWEPISLNNMAFKARDTCDNQEEVCFSSIIQQQDRILMFYNGNHFGYEGLRLAIWTI